MATTQQLNENVNERDAEEAGPERVDDRLENRDEHQDQHRIQRLHLVRQQHRVTPQPAIHHHLECKAAAFLIDYCLLFLCFLQTDLSSNSLTDWIIQREPCWSYSAQNIGAGKYMTNSRNSDLMSATNWR